MHDAGCTAIFYGLESASDTILKSMKKGTTEKEMLRVLEITKEAGIQARGNFIFGDTQETPETAEYTLNWVEDHADLLTSTILTPIRVYPGSELYLRAVRSGRIPDTVQYIRDGCPLINPSEQMDDEAYQILFRDTVPPFTARFSRKKVLQSIEQLNEKIIPEPKSRRYLHTFSCQHCGKNIEEYIYMERLTFEREHYYQCPDCMQRHTFYPGVLMLQQYGSEIFSRLSEKDCAIWGAAGYIANDVYFNIAGFRDAEGLILLDRNPIIQKIGFHGKTVISPERLPELGVNKVYLFTEHNNTEAIKKELEGTPVKAIGLYEILLEE